MSELLRAWLGEAERQRDAAQVALQQGDDRPMKLWALLYGHLLIAKVEELAEALDHAGEWIAAVQVAKMPGVGDTQSEVLDEIESALRAPGGGEG